MKRSNRFLLGGFTIVVWLICGCGAKVRSPEDARLKDNVYTNRFFGFQVYVPDTWTVLKKPSKTEMRKSAEALLGGDKEMTAAVMQSMARVHALLLARNVVAGMSLSVTAEDVSHTSEVRTGKEYLEHALDLVTGPGKPLERVKDIRPVQLFGREFHRVDLAGNVMGMRQQQAMFVIVEKGHALLFVATARSQPAVDEAIAMVGLDGSVPQTASPPKSTRTVAARETPKKAPSEPAWVAGIKLQGIGGTARRRLAIINGKTLGAGDGAQVISANKTVVIRCLSVHEKSATISIDDVAGERELRLN